MKIETVDLYKKYGIMRNKTTGGYLTVYERTEMPELSPRIRPAMLVVPGGAYKGIAAREGEPIALAYLNKGFSAFVLSYSVQTKYPVPLIESMLAIRFIRDNAEKYNTDKDQVCAIGFSAGGHLTGMLATVKNTESEQIGFSADEVRPNAVIMSYPVVTLGQYTNEGTKKVITGGDEDLIEKLSVEKRVDKNSAPAFIWHTYNDNGVPMENALMLADAYRKNNVPFALHIFEHGWHGLALCNDDLNDFTAEQMFLHKVGKWFDLSVDWLQSHRITLRMDK